VEITEVRIKLTDESAERLKAFCSITLDNCFVVRDLKIIEGASGPFVAMPSRKLTFHCPGCYAKNHLRAAYCNQCGRSLRENQPPADDEGRIKLYADIAHPINSLCRELIQRKVVEAYQRELEASRRPGYSPSYRDYDDDWEFIEPPLDAAGAPQGDMSRETGRPASQGGPPSTVEGGASPDQSTAHAPELPRGPHKSQEKKAVHPTPPDTFGAGIF